MKKQQLYRQGFIFIILSGVLWLMYSLSVHSLVTLTQQVLRSKPSDAKWIYWIYEFYPRLQTEKWRFNETFFLIKANQLLLRFILTINIAFGLYIFKNTLYNKLSKTYHRLMDISIDRKFIFYITLLLYTCLLLVIYNAIIEFKALIFFSPFYKPVGIGKLLLPIFPSAIVLWLIYSLLIGSIIAVILFPKKWIAGSIAAIAFIYYQLILFGFGKYDHGYSTLTYALLIYPFFLWEAEQTTERIVPAWGIVLIQWMICLSYFYCGLEKIFTSGPEWFYSNNLQQHLLLHETPIGLQLAEYATLCKFLSLGVLIMQLSFIFLPLQKKLLYILLPLGFLFHNATWLLLEAGGIFNPWWGVYLFFLFPLRSLETK